LDKSLGSGVISEFEKASRAGNFGLQVHFSRCFGFYLW